MRGKLPRPALAAACMAALVASGIRTVAAGDIPAQVLNETVYLDARGLEQLRETNPNHYARARRILAAANYLCRPRAPDLYLARFGAQDLSCAPMLLQTSNPPQWRIGFRLDRTRYVASVFLTDDPPRLLPAH